MNHRIEPTPGGIARFLVERTHQHWQEHKQPYLLSNIAPELKHVHGIDYKAILEPGTTLKQFASTLTHDLKIVVHPIFKAKVGLIPSNSDFVFHAEPTDGATQSEGRPKKPRQPNQRFIVQQFLTALSRLSEDELKSVNIPVHILAKLMEEK